MKKQTLRGLFMYTVRNNINQKNNETYNSFINFYSAIDLNLPYDYKWVDSSGNLSNAVKTPLEGVEDSQVYRGVTHDGRKYIIKKINDNENMIIYQRSTSDPKDIVYARALKENRSIIETGKYTYDILFSFMGIEV